MTVGLKDSLRDEMMVCWKVDYWVLLLGVRRVITSVFQTVASMAGNLVALKADMWAVMKAEQRAEMMAECLVDQKAVSKAVW
jgi:hypothetical protein